MVARPSFQDSDSLEYLKELGSGPFGIVWLARVLKGCEAGRLVTARRISTAQLDAAEIECVVEISRRYASLTHPSLAKILGVHKSDEDLVLLEEHVPGVPLRTLQQLAAAQQTPIPVGIAVRVILDALRTAEALRQNCLNLSALVPNRVIFPDTVIVANYGESLLSAIGVAQELCRCQKIRECAEVIEILDPEELVGKTCADERFEVFTAGAMLWQLLVVRGLFGDLGNQQSLNAVLHAHNSSVEDHERLKLYVPQPVATIIRHATLRDLGLRYRTLGEMIQAIEKLPAVLIGKDNQIRAWLENLAGEFLLQSQWSAGIGTSQLDSQPPTSGRSPSQRPSFTDNFLPWDQPTLAARGATWKPSRNVPRAEAPSAVAFATQSYPATTVSSNLMAVHGPQRTIRRAYIAGAVLGLALALGLSYLVSLFRSSSASAAGVPLPSQTTSASLNLAGSDRTGSISRRKLQDPTGGQPSSVRSKETADVQLGSNIEPVPDAGLNQTQGDETSSDRAKADAAHARSKTSVRSGASTRGANDRWGI